MTTKKGPVTSPTEVRNPGKKTARTGKKKGFGRREKQSWAELHQKKRGERGEEKKNKLQKQHKSRMVMVNRRIRNATWNILRGHGQKTA